MTPPQLARPLWSLPPPPYFTEPEMDELRSKLDDLREMVARLVERGEAGKEDQVELRADLKALEARVQKLETETAKLTVKVGGIVAGALVVMEAVQRLMGGAL